MATSLVNKLSRGTVRLVVDHHTVFHAQNVVSIHVIEVGTNDETIKGEDRDGVTPEDLGGTGEIAALITNKKLVDLIASESGLPTSSDVLPPPPPKVEEAAKPAADAAP